MGLSSATLSPAPSMNLSPLDLQFILLNYVTGLMIVQMVVTKKNCSVVFYEYGAYGDTECDALFATVLHTYTICGGVLFMQLESDTSALLQFGESSLAFTMLDFIYAAAYVNAANSSLGLNSIQGTWFLNNSLLFISLNVSVSGGSRSPLTSAIC